MIELKNITKVYETGGETVHALRGIDLQFRENDFVSILGPSGCGKTTLLNIIGGLDQYTTGDLVINGTSTREYNDRDWDTYRNHSVGFVFQSYNLIPHQTVLSNVEMALTLSGVKKGERRRRAVQALEAVGLGDQLGKRPAQMSGGQMQRVAIARAIVNDPEIILADEPTGALDTETSVQVMDILKEISRDRLVVMVTHNPDLAERYSTRVINMLDGQILGDSRPLSEQEVRDGRDIAREKLALSDARKPVMKFSTAFGLSLRNLFTKKGRTMLTAFAGSIGIIGIALIYAVSQGTSDYIDDVQQDTLSTYPLTIMTETSDMTSMITGIMENEKDAEQQPDGTISERPFMTSFFAQIGTNDLKSFKGYLEDHYDEVEPDLNALAYGYGITPQIYTRDSAGELLQANPGIVERYLTQSMGPAAQSNPMMQSSGLFNEMIENRELLDSQFDFAAGRWPENYNEVVLVLSSPGRITDMLTYTIGLRPAEELDNMVNTIMEGGVVESTPDPLRLTTDQLLNLDLRLIHAADYYVRNAEHNVWEDRSGEEGWMEQLYENAEKLTVVGIVAPKDGVAATALAPGFAYLPSLTQHIIDHAAQSEIVQAQLGDRETDVFSGSRFDADEGEENALDFQNMITVDQAALARAFGGGNVPDMASMMQNMTLPESTVDPAAAQTDLLTALGRLGRGMLQSFVAQNGEGAILTADMAEGLAASYLASGAAASDLAHLKSTYPLPEAALNQMFQPMLAGLVTSYVAAASQPTLPPDFDISDLPAGIDPSMLENMDPAMIAQIMQQMGLSGNTSGGAPITSGAIDTAVSQYTGSAAITAAAGQMAQQLSNAAAQAAMAESMGEMMQQMAGAMQVDPGALAQAFRFNMTQDDLTRLMQALARGNSAATAAGNLQQLGYADVTEPAQISVFLKDFEGKERFISFLDRYNDEMEAAGKDDQVIQYTDITGVLMSSVTTIINAITYVLIAFVAISLIVSSIMIGVITLISVQERTKEIGILRAIGASKKNVSSMFNAETMIIGFVSGLIGVLVTYLLCIPINAVLHKLTGIATLGAKLPLLVAVILIIISMTLTLVAGVIPSRSAAKKDPVEALRTE